MGEVELTGQVTARLVSPPAQYLPATQRLHGLVPDTVPVPRYPGLQRQPFCTPVRTGEWVLRGHALEAVPAHQ